jgi:hypothetical protein
MWAGEMRRRVAAMLVVCVVALAGAASAQTAEDAALDAESIRLYQAGKYASAAKVARQLLALREKTPGPDHPTDVLDAPKARVRVRGTWALTLAVVQAPRDRRLCMAKTRKGTPCIRRVVPGKDRCRSHLTEVKAPAEDGGRQSTHRGRTACALVALAAGACHDAPTARQRRSSALTSLGRCEPEVPCSM